ncbi:MAG: hypothetical protein ACN0LA_12700 [Candidatus Longimicrobiales bacterium M2_2A_002]
MTVQTRAPATRRDPKDRAGPPALGPLALDLTELGTRGRGLIDRIRVTEERVAILSRGRPVALISAYDADEADPP